MKALILAAGFGTRLLPYTRKIPKPLFSLLSTPMLDHAIQKLVSAGCEHIIINTHHLHEQIKTFVDRKKYPVKIKTLFEPVILDTGGAIANAKPFLNQHPFFVINSDIISSVDLQKVYEFHQTTGCLATLVLHDYPEFNKVGVDAKGYVRTFDSPADGLAFTGIQVLSPQIYDHLPKKKIFSSIPVYQMFCRQNQVKAFVADPVFWSDIGTPASYAETSLLTLAASAWGINQEKIREIHVDELAQDGSDRRWYRTTYGNKTLIISDHGICLPGSNERLQLNAFVHIGEHLFSKGLPLPRILNHDALSGMVVLEDLGDFHLATEITESNDTDLTLNRYKTVIDHLIDFSIKGIDGFKKEWTCQTDTYSKELIIEKECRYFMEAFIQSYKKLALDFDEFSEEFDYISDQALRHGFMGLMHRDMQSKNIMVRNDRIYFIDFQGARTGPLQYDLASLLIDPYVHLDDLIKTQLLQYAMDKLNLTRKYRQNFSHCYQYCCLTRNLQFLGAFSFLSQKKKKKKFETYIPDAIMSLKKIISGLETDKIPKLRNLVQTL